MATDNFYNTQKGTQGSNMNQYPAGVQVYTPLSSYTNAPQDQTDDIYEEYDFENIKHPTRIAVYDDFLSTPRVVVVEPCPVKEYLSQISEATYRFLKEQNSTIPFMVINELVQNFIHAYFIEPTISIFDHGKTVRFTDQGPGISNIELAKQPGITSANSKMKQYINGVGSGLPQVNEYLLMTGGSLNIKNNIKSGCVVTISVGEQTENLEDQITLQQQVGVSMGNHSIELENYQDYLQWKKTMDQQSMQININEREKNILLLIFKYGKVGPTEVKQYLAISESTAHRALVSLEEKGFIQADDTGNKKRSLTEQGFLYVKNKLIEV